jgi:biopolymer transport protein ExbD
MLNESVLKATTLSEPLASALAGSSYLKPAQRRKKKSLMFALTLTSLIDAFSILVIYLLVNFGSTTEAIQVAKGVNLPSASQYSQLDGGTVVNVVGGRYFIENVDVAQNDIVKKLIEIRQSLAKSNAGQNPSLIIQADRKADYAALSPVIQAASQAGFSQMKFAVLRGEVAQKREGAR